MSISGPYRVRFEEQFPFGVGVVGAVAPQSDFDASTKEKRVQARDKDTGLPVWVVDVMDFDPDARERVFRVKIAAPVQPVPPAAVEGAPVAPVVLDGVQVTPYVKEGTKRIAFSVRATGLREVGSKPAGDAGKAA